MIEQGCLPAGWQNHDAYWALHTLSCRTTECWSESALLVVQRLQSAGEIWRVACRWAITGIWSLSRACCKDFLSSMPYRRSTVAQQTLDHAVWHLVISAGW